MLAAALWLALAHVPAYVVLWQRVDEKGGDHIEATTFATPEAIEKWLNGCETLEVQEDGQTFEEETCEVRFIDPSEAPDEPRQPNGYYVPGDRLIGVFELGHQVNLFALTGPRDPTKEDYNPRWRLR